MTNHNKLTMMSMLTHSLFNQCMFYFWFYSDWWMKYIDTFTVDKSVDVLVQYIVLGLIVFILCFCSLHHHLDNLLQNNQACQQVSTITVFTWFWYNLHLCLTLMNNGNCLTFIFYVYIVQLIINTNDFADWRKNPEGTSVML